jgi:tRNA-guanine transglycosylase
MHSPKDDKMFLSRKHKKESDNNNLDEEINIKENMKIPPVLQAVKRKLEKPLQLEIVARFNKARACKLTLPHAEVETPVYMPVGTKAAMKGLLSCDMERMGCRLMLSNTYHLTLQPGEEFIDEEYKGVHGYMNWNNNLLTDSGGFQMVSLAELSERSEQGVEFVSHIEGDKRKIMLTPEKSIEIQNKLGADIIMALDDVIKPTSNDDDLKDACERTLRWIDRCINAHSRKDVQNLFGIVQGGLDLEMRKYCTVEMIKRDLPGYAIGGLAGGEKKDDFWKVVDTCTEYLPEDKPRYLMGVGYPIDLVVCSLLGVDMFDCVFATRTARFGTAFTHKGFHKLKSEKNKFDFGPIEKDCGCEVCLNYTRSYFYLMLNKNPRAVNLISYHNVHYLLDLMKKLRASIIQGDKAVNTFVSKFITDLYSDFNYPVWVYEALTKAGIDTEFMKDFIKDDNLNNQNFD